MDASAEAWQLLSRSPKFRISGLGFRVSGLGFRVSGLGSVGFRVCRV